MPTTLTTRNAVNAAGKRMRSDGWRHVCNGTDWETGKMFTVWQRGQETRYLTFPEVAAYGSIN